MIYINRDFEKSALAHYYKIKDDIEKKIDNGHNYINSKNKPPLSDFHKRCLKIFLKEIILANPDKLIRIFNLFENKFPNTDYRLIFDYKWFSSKSRKYGTYELAKILGIRICCYCNRNYTTTVIRKNEKISRPQFDHFYYKKKYSILALSFYNLIPSCSLCNTTFKGEKDYNILHPYIDNIVSNFGFTAIPQNITTLLNVNEDFKINIVKKDKKNILNSKLDESIKLFKIKEMYSSNGSEIKDLFLLRYKYSDKYLEELQKMTKNKFTKPELYRLAFGAEINETDFEKRPFSKLKKDILKELKILKP
ncbi:hypothetical protein GCM10022217_01630 [Chryseobacterium ginsenosidimutans]|uniref:hypothetical protein n=1 Tax=Chryseobacterium ginsenosidimutans TaxID=687846 RepID=UPI0031D81370